jgi:uncharacterized protein (UPF0261 family)
VLGLKMLQERLREKTERHWTLVALAAVPHVFSTVRLCMQDFGENQLVSDNHAMRSNYAHVASRVLVLLCVMLVDDAKHMAHAVTRWICLARLRMHVSVVNILSAEQSA